MPQIARIHIEVTDSAGNRTAGDGSVTLASAPVVSLSLNPTVLPASGGVVDVRIVASSPDGLPVSISAATVDMGTLTVDPADRFHYSWRLP